MATEHTEYTDVEMDFSLSDYSPSLPPSSINMLRSSWRALTGTP